MIKRFSVLMLLIVLLSGCDFGFQKMEAGEYGVKFRALPRYLGGGIENTVLEPGEMEFIFPWETIYRVNTSIQSIGWGGMGQGDNRERTDYIETRAVDGNEVGLAITLQYHVDPPKAKYVVKYVGLNNIRPLVAAVARADIRTHMNALSTSGFINPNERSSALESVRKALNYRLNREGIIVDEVIYVDHRFERRLANGEIVDTYQQIIDQAQAKGQEVEREPKSREATAKQKEKEYFESQAAVNQVKEGAKGYQLQSQARGDNYLKEKQNTAQQILATGLAEVEGLKKQIAALSGPGGKALLRLAIATRLIKNNPTFVVLNSGGQGANAVDVNRMDTNELLKQIKATAAAKEGLDQQGK